MRLIIIISIVGLIESFTPALNNVHTNYYHHHRQTGTRIGPRYKLVLNQSSENRDDKSSIDVMMGKLDIPEEYREEIFRAEANTPAAKDRDTRVAFFATIALLGIVVSSFNAFLTTMRDGGDLSGINDLGFGWTSGNFLTSFLFLNKFGGGLALLSAGLGGTMVELEQRTKNENAERIWAELQRRRSQSENRNKKKKERKGRKMNSPSKKAMSKKNRKRLDALSEVIIEKDTVSVEEKGEEVQVEQSDASSTSDASMKEKKGMFGKVKDFYEKADSMAQSQALLLNKELEDRGVVEKITDETGLKVIGKKSAAELQKKAKEENEPESI